MCGSGDVSDRLLDVPSARPIVVTGATGFLGGAVAARLRAMGVPVRALGRNRAVLAALQAGGVDARSVALDDRDAMLAACADARAILHCGALSSPWGRLADFEAANVRGTAHVLESARQSGARVVHISSPSVYFRFGDREMLREDAAQDGDAPTPYIATKRAAERLVNAAVVDGVWAIGLRPRALFGPGDTTLLPRVLRAARSGRLRIIGDGQTRADLTYIDNAVDAVLAALDAPDACCGRWYNVTNGEPHRLWEVLGTLCGMLDAPLQSGRIPRGVAMTVATLLERVAARRSGYPEPILTRYGVAVLSYHQTLDIRSAQTELGYQPRVSMFDGLIRTIEWAQGALR